MTGSLSLLLLLVHAIAIVAGTPARAAGERLVVFTKNKVNPNYVAFSLGADPAAIRLGASTLHRVPEKPDDAPFPQIDGVIAANDSMAIGALAALDRAKRSAKVVGLNDTMEAAEAIRAGRLLTSEDYSGFAPGCLTAETAIRHLRGQKVPAEIMLPVRIIERSNVAEWLVPVEQRECPDWDTAGRK